MARPGHVLAANSASIKSARLICKPSKATRLIPRRDSHEETDCPVRRHRHRPDCRPGPGRDLGPDEALKLRDAGTIKSFEELNKNAIAKHPGSSVHDTELEEEYGRYIYQVELRDPQGVKWDLELDAATGAVLKDHQDD